MVTRDAAESAAQAVIDQAREEAKAQKNRSARRSLYPLYRFDELRELEPWQRGRIMRQACSLADRELPVMASCFVWLVLILIVAVASPSWFDNGGRSMLAVVVFGLPFFLIRRGRVHHHVRWLLQSERQSARP